MKAVLEGKVPFKYTDLSFCFPPMYSIFAILVQAFDSEVPLSL